MHLDGSIDLEDLYAICRARQLQLPDGIGLPESAADVKRLLDLRPGWHRFDVVNDIIGGDVETIRRAAEAFVGFQAHSCVGYTEVRYDPVRLARSALANASVTEEAAVRAVQEGLAAGATKYGVAAYQLLCAMRGQSPARCLQTAQLAAHMRSSDMGGVVGLDLAGDEITYPNGQYVECFRHAKRALKLNTTVHSGEFVETTAAEVRSAVLEMEVDRVGHGYAAAKDEATMQLLKARKMHLEVCPKSSLMHGNLDSVQIFLAHGLSFGLNTDDPASFLGNTSAAEDEVIVKTKLGFTDADVSKAYAAALSVAFGAPGMHREVATVVI